MMIIVASTEVIPRNLAHYLRSLAMTRIAVLVRRNEIYSTDNKIESKMLTCVSHFSVISKETVAMNGWQNDSSIKEAQSTGNYKSYETIDEFHSFNYDHTKLMLSVRAEIKAKLIIVKT